MTEIEENKKDKNSAFSTNKKHLNRYIVLTRKINVLEGRFYEYFKIENKSEKQQQIINDTFVRLNNLLDQSDCLRLQIYETIDTLDNMNEIKVLEAFFIFDKTLAEIAADMNYSERHINRIYKSGVLNIDLKD